MKSLLAKLFTADRADSLSLLIAFILFQVSSSAQIVRGRVTDINSNEPLKDVIVMVVDSINSIKIKQTTDSMGLFLVAPASGIKFNIKTYYYGYVSVTTGSYLLTKNDTMSLVIRVEKEPAAQVLKDETPNSPVVNEIEVPDFYIAAEMNKNSSNNNNAGESTDAKKEGAYTSASLLFLPRQIIEVFPKEIEGAKGIITLSVNIDESGYVKEYKIIKNTVNKKECMENVLNAANKSRWQPVIIEGRKINYWIEKSYEFN